MGECCFVSKCDIKRERECQQYNFWHKGTQMNTELLSSGRVLGADGPLTMGSSLKVRGCSNVILDDFGAKLKDESRSYTTKH